MTTPNCKPNRPKNGIKLTAIKMKNIAKICTFTYLLLILAKFPLSGFTTFLLSALSVNINKITFTNSK